MFPLKSKNYRSLHSRQMELAKECSSTARILFKSPLTAGLAYCAYVGLIEETKALNWTQDLLVVAHYYRHYQSPAPPAQLSQSSPSAEKTLYFIDYWQKETSLLQILRTGRKRRGRCSHTVDIYSEGCFTKAALEHTTAKELLLWRPCRFRPGLWYGLLIHTLLWTCLEYYHKYISLPEPFFFLFLNNSYNQKRRIRMRPNSPSCLFFLEWVVVFFQGSSKLWPLKAKSVLWKHGNSRGRSIWVQPPYLGRSRGQMLMHSARELKQIASSVTWENTGSLGSTSWQN